MIFMLSVIFHDQDNERHSYIPHNLLKGMDNRIIFTSSEFYGLLRCLRDDILQLDQHYKCETVLCFHWEKEKNQYVVDISNRLYSATLTAKQITE